jgi:hypothetical protein
VLRVLLSARPTLLGASFSSRQVGLCTRTATFDTPRSDFYSMVLAVIATVTGSARQDWPGSESQDWRGMRCMPVQAAGPGDSLAATRKKVVWAGAAFRGHSRLGPLAFSIVSILSLFQVHTPSSPWDVASSERMPSPALPIPIAHAPWKPAQAGSPRAAGVRKGSLVTPLHARLRAGAVP